MKAMVFAAGRGERMRPLTDTVPKPLLAVAGRPLVVWHLEKLAARGIRDVVINLSHLASVVRTALGDGGRWGLRIAYSDEGPLPLETGGGLLQALPMLGGEPFLLVNADVWSDVDYGSLPDEPSGLANLVLVDNPDHHAAGDFWLTADDQVLDDSPPEGAKRLTYAGVGVYRPEILQGWRAVIGHAPGARDMPPRFPLAPLLRAAMRKGQVSGRHHAGRWCDVGTPGRLASLDRLLTGLS
ncbi:MAG: nucleotidyltransferase family protein [Xanthomonadales bacterium]|nr:nucleotidyltransferase family protein [Xanthomonadales bacterium]